MGQIRKVGDTYYIEFYARGLMYSQIAGTDLGGAQRLLEKTESKIAGGEALTTVRQIDLAVFFQEFLEDVRKNLGQRTAQRFEDMLSHFSVFLKKNYPAVTTLSQITPSVVESYKASRLSTTKPHLVNFTLLLLREVLEYGIKLGFINDNSTLHTRLLNTPKRTLKDSRREKVAQELFSKNVGLIKVCALMQLTDIARVMYYGSLISPSREGIYG